MYEKIFRTFCKGYGKAPSEFNLDREHIRTWEECKDLRSFGGLLFPGFMDVSIDDAQMSEKTLEMIKGNHWMTMVLRNPTNGHIHTYWKMPKKWKNGADKTLACGLIADIHSGGTYVPIRVDDVTRECIYDIGPKDEYQELPEELWPIEQKGKTPLPKLWQMKEEKRNDTLFKYILTLCRNHIGDEDHEIARRVIRNINWYIFAESLPDDEMETILREDAFPTTDQLFQGKFYGGKTGDTFLHRKFAENMVEYNHVVEIDNQLHIYNDGIYTPDLKEIESIIARCFKELRKAQRAEVLADLRLIAPKAQKADSRYIAFENGIYNIETGELSEFTPDIVITNKIPVEYSPNATSDIGNKTLNDWSCGDPSVRALLEECVGYCLYRENSLRKAFILTGGKRNGKSVFLDWIKATLGEENICALDLKELDDRFSTAMMYGKLANIGDDISDDFLQGSAVALFKKIVSGNRIKAEQKGKDPFEFNPYVKLIFSANEIPRIRDSSGAVMDRLIIIPFDATFEEGSDRCDPFLKYKLCEKKQKEYLIRVAVEGLQRVLKRQRFTESERVAARVKEYSIENNPLESFLEDRDIEETVNHTTLEVYNAYSTYCSQNKANPIGRNKFTRLVNTALGLETKKARVNGEVTSVFKRVNK